jgi:hypothetical protein
MTVGRLGQESLRCASRQVEMGLPPSPGDLQPGGDHARLRGAALDRATELIVACFAEATREYDTVTLAALQTALHAAIPEESHATIRDSAISLDAIRMAAAVACADVETAVARAWHDKVVATLADDALPFRLQRFSRFRRRLAAYCAAEAPHLSDATLPAVLGFLDQALTVTSSPVTLEHVLCADGARVTIRLARAQLIGAIIHHFALGFVVPTEHQLATGLTAVVDTVFQDHVQEQEAESADRKVLAARQHRVDTSARQLLQLVDPEIPADSDQPLAETVRSVLPKLFDAHPAFSVELRQCGAAGPGLRGPVYGGQRNVFMITSKRIDSTPLTSGGLPFVATLWRAVGGGTPFPVTVSDNGDGTYACTYTVPLPEVDAAITAAHGDEGRAAMSAEYMCGVSLYGLPVRGSPFRITVHTVDPEWYTVDGIAGMSATEATFNVVQRAGDHQAPQSVVRDPLPLPAAAVQLRVGIHRLDDGRRLVGRQLATATMVGNADGTCTVRYTAPAVGAATEYSISVCLGETHIVGSPATITVVPGRLFTYQSDFDKNGVLHYIGANGGPARAYQTPDHRGVTVSGYPTGAHSLPIFMNNIVSHEYTGCACVTPNKQYNVPRTVPTCVWISIDLGAARRLRLTHYTLRFLNLRKWQIEGSEDGNVWTPLKVHQNDNSFVSVSRVSHQGAYDQGNRGYKTTASWPVDPAQGSFRHFRLYSDDEKLHDHQHGYMMCGGIELYGFFEGR